MNTNNQIMNQKQNPTPLMNKRTSKGALACSCCEKPAIVEVHLYDFYPNGLIFFEPDDTCPHLCRKHMLENEASIQGERKPRGSASYKYTNRLRFHGFTIYNPLKASASVVFPTFQDDEI